MGIHIVNRNSDFDVKSLVIGLNEIKSCSYVLKDEQSRNTLVESMNNTRFKSNICKFIGNVYKDMLNNFELRFNVLIYHAVCKTFDQDNL